MRNNVIILCAFAVLLNLASCKKFLDVKPKTSLSEDEIFTSEVGFQQALNGTYTQLAARNLYGDYLTMSFVSALSQDYAVNASGPFIGAKNLVYTSAAAQGQISAIWSSAFTSIAGLNKIITATETERSVLTAESYSRIRGEALGIRALLHFDLLRLFGPEYTAGQDVKSIPFRTIVSDEPGMPLTGKVVMDAIIADLAESAELLKAVDPVIAPVAIGNRNIRMNYYAVKGLEARAKIYKGDKSGAYAAALDVISAMGPVPTTGVQPKKFPFVVATAAAAAPASRDRLYVTELVFMLRVRDLRSWTDGNNTYFKTGNPATNYLTLSDANFKALYETAAGGGTDLRYLYRVETDQATIFPTKYWQTWINSVQGRSDLTPDRLDQIIPLIRISELYYILAESAPTTAESISFLNLVRKARGLTDLSATIAPEVLEAEILKEYRKEFHGEGQLFYYYKRKKALRMQFHNATVTLTQANYVLPIPQAEKENNPNYN